MNRFRKWILPGLLLTFLVAACVQTPSLTLPTLIRPTVVPSRTAAATVTPLPVVSEMAGTLTAVPTLTATPRLHTVALGETLLTIAWKYGLTLNALRDANPEIDPNILIVGQQIIIPEATPADTVENPTPTPLALTLSLPRCIADANGGVWCLLSAVNPASGSENIAAEVRLFGAGSVESLDRLAVAPLNHSEAGESMPLAVYYSPQELAEASLAPPYQAQAALVQALPLGNTAGRYLPVTVEKQETTLTEDGPGAAVSGELRLDEDSPAAASRIWLVAALYDDAGQLLGFRRWESPQPLAPGESIAFSLLVYALDETPIQTVVLLTEAMP